VVLGASPVFAQDQGSRLRAQQDTLARLRREREQLERRSADLQSTVHDLSEEVSNLNQRAEATARIVKALDSQLEMIKRRGRLGDA
jgi:predicted RNase H-like nuclease (RuvC/YqgF family)